MNDPSLYYLSVPVAVLVAIAAMPLLDDHSLVVPVTVVAVTVLDFALVMISPALAMAASMPVALNGYAARSYVHMLRDSRYRRKDQSGCSNHHRE